MKQNIDGNILIEDLKAETNGKRWLIKKMKRPLSTGSRKTRLSLYK